MAVYRASRTCRFTDELYLKVRYIANTENRSFNNWMENTLKKIVADYEKENGVIPVQTDDLYQ